MLNWHIGKDGNMSTMGWRIQLDPLEIDGTETKRWSLRFEDWDGPIIGDYSDDPEALKALAQRVDDAMNGRDALSRIDAEARRLRSLTEDSPTPNASGLIWALIDHFDHVSRWLKDES